MADINRTIIDLDVSGNDFGADQLEQIQKLIARNQELAAENTNTSREAPAPSPSGPRATPS